MKRFFVIPVMFLYLIAVSGILIQVHYCGQRLDSWNMYGQNEGCADGDCGEESRVEHSCCKDEIVAAKVSSAQNTVKEFQLKIYNTAVLVPGTVTYAPAQSVALPVSVGMACRANAPPGLWQQIPLYKLHARLTYYG